MTRSRTSRSDLLRHGFVDSDRTLAGMAQLGDHAEPLVALLGRTADPDLALAGLVLPSVGSVSSRHCSG